MAPAASCGARPRPPADAADATGRAQVARGRQSVTMPPDRTAGKPTSAARRPRWWRWPAPSLTCGEREYQPRWIPGAVMDPVHGRHQVRGSLSRDDPPGVRVAIESGEVAAGD